MNKKDTAMAYGKEHVIKAFKKLRLHDDDTLAQLEMEKPFEGFEKLWAVICLMAMLSEQGILLPPEARS